MLFLSLAVCSTPLTKIRLNSLHMLFVSCGIIVAGVLDLWLQSVMRLDLNCGLFTSVFPPVLLNLLLVKLQQAAGSG